MKTATKALGVVATIGMFVVLVMGATVTNTGSEHGCGRSWPLCHGKLIPQFTVSVFIEFSHRAVVGVESVFIIALAAAGLYLYWHRTEIRILAPVMVLFLLLQAGLGAWAVMAPQLAWVLALHFGVSLIAFASVLLATAVIFEMDGWDTLRRRPLPRGYPQLAWGIAAYSYVVVYLGAYVRHTNADDACTGWPLCNGQVIPVFHDKVGAIFLHRAAAGVLVLAILGLAIWSWQLRSRRPDSTRAGLLALAAVLLQAGIGAIVVFTNMDLFSALAHAAVSGLLFGSLTYLCMHVLPISRRAEDVATTVVKPSPGPEPARSG